MVKVALLVRLQAKPGKETAVARFLESALDLANQEATTPVWFRCVWGHQLSVFSMLSLTKPDAAAHLSGPIAAALMANASELLTEPPQIEHVDVLAAKLPQ